MIPIGDITGRYSLSPTLRIGFWKIIKGSGGLGTQKGRISLRKGFVGERFTLPKRFCGGVTRIFPRTKMGSPLGLGQAEKLQIWGGRGHTRGTVSWGKGENTPPQKGVWLFGGQKKRGGVKGGRWRNTRNSPTRGVPT